jgi:hypothetical protein
MPRPGTLFIKRRPGSRQPEQYALELGLFQIPGQCWADGSLLQVRASDRDCYEAISDGHRSDVETLHGVFEAGTFLVTSGVRWGVSVKADRPGSMSCGRTLPTPRFGAVVMTTSPSRQETIFPSTKTSWPAPIPSLFLRIDLLAVH